MKDKKTFFLILACIGVGLFCIVLTVVLCLKAAVNAMNSDNGLASPSSFDNTSSDSTHSDSTHSGSTHSGSSHSHGSHSSGHDEGNSGPDDNAWDDSDSDNFNSDDAGSGSVTPAPSYDGDVLIVYSDPGKSLSELNDYLDTFTSFIDESTSYTLNWDFENQSLNDGTVSWVVSYYQLEGEIPNLEGINEALMEMGTYGRDIYLEAYGTDSYYAGTYQAQGTTYITYNDENFLSAITVTTIEASSLYDSASYKMSYIDCLNVDLTTGTILSNMDIFQANNDFVTRLRTQSALQNGELELLASQEDSWYLDYLTDEEMSIVFFSPKGLEVGFNYEAYGENLYYTGYLTITLNEYSVTNLLP